MNNLKYGIGIDMSMEKFNVCISIIDNVQRTRIVASTSFTNTLKGFEAFLSWVNKHQKFDLPKQFIVEATGVYHENLTWFLHSMGMYVVVILPTRAKRYLQSLGLKSKNDKIDANGLSRMICEQTHPKWDPFSVNIYTLRTITRQINSTNKHITSLKNQ